MKTLSHYVNIFGPYIVGINFYPDATRIELFKEKYRDEFPWVKCFDRDKTTDFYFEKFFPKNEWFMRGCPDKILGNVLIFTEFVTTNYETLEAIGFEKIRINVSEYNSLLMIYFEDETSKVMAKLLGMKPFRGQL